MLKKLPKLKRPVSVKSTVVWLLFGDIDSVKSTDPSMVNQPRSSNTFFSTNWPFGS